MTSLSFSGGGWNTHTALSATFSAALKQLRSETTSSASFNDLFDSVESISSNSGGSWFLGMLAFSNRFEISLAENPSDWFKTGYMGQMDQIFTQSEKLTHLTKNEAARLLEDVFGRRRVKRIRNSAKDVESDSGNHKRYFSSPEALGINNALKRIGSLQDGEEIDIAELALGSKLFRSISQGQNKAEQQILNEIRYIVGLARLADQTSFSWNSLNHELTFKPYDMNEELEDTTMSSTRNEWAMEKDILMSSSMFTQQAALSRSLKNVTASNIKGPEQVGATPFFITSPGKDNQRKVSTLSAGDFRLNYETLRSKRDKPYNRLLEGDFLADLPVLDATAASSAAIGAFASLATQYPKQFKRNGRFITSFLRNYAVAGFLPNQKDSLQLLQGKQPTANNSSLRELSENRYLRFGDGAYVDNTSAAYQLSSMQQEGITNGFEISIFDNYTDTGVSVEELLIAIDSSASDIITGRPYNISSSLASLFGYVGNPEYNYSSPTAYFTSELLPGVTYQQMSSWVFKPEAFQGKSPDWEYVASYSEGGGENTFNKENDPLTRINYWKLDVETVDNPTIGVVGGFKGVIRVFENSSPSSSSLPYTPEILKGYEDVFNITQDAYLTGGGWNHLKEAIGLT